MNTFRKPLLLADRERGVGAARRMYARALSYARRIWPGTAFKGAIKLGIIGGLHLLLIGMLSASALPSLPDDDICRLDVRVTEEKPRAPAVPVKPNRIFPMAPVSAPAQPAPPVPVMTAAAPSAAPTPGVAPAPQPSAPDTARAETPPVAAPVQAVAAPAAPVTPPRFDASYLRNPAPAYPRASRVAGQQGQVVLKVLVNGEGAAMNVQVQRSSGFARLDEAALDAVRQWRFVPAKRGSESIEDWVLVPIAFRLGA